MIGDRIRVAREEMGLTQKELARLMEIKHYQQIGRWERNEVEVNLENLRKLSKALNKTMDELAGD